MRTCAVIHGSQDVRRVLDVLDGKALVDRLGLEVWMAVGDLLDRSRIVVAAVDGFLEDGRIRGDAAETVLVDEAFEFAAGDQAAADEVEPDGLAVLPE